MKTERALSAQEIKTLDKRKRKINGRNKLWNRYALRSIAAWTIGWTAIGVYTGQSGLMDVGAIVVVIVIYSGPLTWLFLRERNRDQNALKKIEDVRKLSRVTSIKIKTTEFYELEEEDDEGVHYLFQIAPDKIICFGGEDFGPTKKFPNSDFEIVEGKGSEGQVIFRKIYSHGNRIEPLKIIEGTEKRELLAKPKPEEYQILDGRLK